MERKFSSENQEFRLENLDSTSLLTQVEFIMNNIAQSDKYIELREVASECVEIISIIKNRNIRTLGRIAVKSNEQMLREYIEQGGEDVYYIKYLSEQLEDTRD